MVWTRMKSDVDQATVGRTLSVIDEGDLHAGFVLGPIVLLVWLDTAYISHSITGTGLLIWIVLSSMDLVIGVRDHEGLGPSRGCQLTVKNFTITWQLGTIRSPLVDDGSSLSQTSPRNRH